MLISVFAGFAARSKTWWTLDARAPEVDGVVVIMGLLGLW
jgi:hypothetical protein